MTRNMAASNEWSKNINSIDKEMADHYQIFAEKAYLLNLSEQVFTIHKNLRKMFGYYLLQW